MDCILSASFHMLWNMEYTESIQQSRGIRQGDPISPYVFVLCLERLAHRIQNEVNDGRWRPLRALRHGPGISHLFFVNDLLLFEDNSSTQMRVIMNCLDDFSKASGQRINLEKSKVFFSTNFNKEEATRISRQAGISCTEDLGPYLGTQLVHHRLGKTQFCQLVERQSKIMDAWKLKNLSLA